MSVASQSGNTETVRERFDGIETAADGTVSLSGFGVRHLLNDASEHSVEVVSDHGYVAKITAVEDDQTVTLQLTQEADTGGEMGDADVAAGDGVNVAVEARGYN